MQGERCLLCHLVTAAAPSSGVEVSAVTIPVANEYMVSFYRDGGAFSSSLNNEMVDRMKAANS